MIRLNKQFLFSALPTINLLLFVGMILLISSLIINLLRYDKGVVFDKQRLTRGMKSPDVSISGSLNRVPAFTEANFQGRQLFHPLTARKKQQKQEVIFELLGVISVGQKNAATIRSKKEGKDYYCREGDEIDSFQVKQILRDKVILESEDEILEITR